MSKLVKIAANLVGSLVVSCLGTGVRSGLATEAQLPAGFHLVAKDDFTTVGRYPWLVAGHPYFYSEGNIAENRIPLDDAARHVVTGGKQIIMRFNGLEGDAAYMIRVAYLSASNDRVVQLRADAEILQQSVKLPYGEVDHYELTLPPNTCQDGAVELIWTNLGGANVVLSDIELWSTKEAPLPFLDLEAMGDLKGQLVGRVLDRNGKPVVTARIEVTAGNSQQAVDAQTDERGKFRLAIPRRWRQRGMETLRVVAVQDKLQSECWVSMAEVFMPRLTPHPVVVQETASPKRSLKGVWRFHTDPPDNFHNAEAEPGNGWADIAVPGEWAMQGFTVKSHEPGGYRLKFHVPDDWRDRRVKLRFDAVYSEADVWLNGKNVGSHLGAFTPFELDVTDAVVPGDDNLLALAVTSEGLGEDLVAGRIMVGHQMGGIIRRASIFAVPETNIASLHVDSTFDDTYRDATLHVALKVANESQHEVEDMTVRFHLREATPGKRPVAISPTRFSLPALGAGELASRTVQIPVAAPKQWNAEDPNLYLIDCVLEVNGRPVQTVQRRFGFRQVEVRGYQVFLNGVPIRFRGASRQDSHPLTGRTVPADIQRRDIELLAWANCNNAYTCAFSPDEDFLNLCDEMGLYVMEEPGTCWAGMDYWGNEALDALWGSGDYDAPAFYPRYLLPMLEIIKRGRSHPSILTWMLADESKFGVNFQRVLDQVKKLDPSRPVHFAYDPGGDIFDIGSMHYPWFKGLAQAARSKRPVIFDQFCHVYLFRPELMTDPGLRDFWGEDFATFWEAIWNTPSMLGGQFFNFTDDVFLMPSGEELGYGVWGMIDPWRRPKPELWHLKKTYTPVKIHKTSLSIPDSRKVLRIDVENRYDFTNLSELRIEWDLDGESGTAQADIPAKSQGQIEIRPETDELDGKTLSLKFVRKGVLVDMYNLTIGIAPKDVRSAEDSTSVKPTLELTDDRITIGGEEWSWTIDRHAGEFRAATAGEHTVLVGGPMLMVLPHKGEQHTSGYPTPKTSIVPFNETCHDWKAEQVTTTESIDGVQVVVTGKYREAEGQYGIRINGAGHATVDYRFTYHDDVDPRQIGMVFYVAKSCDTLRWKRRAQWTAYPEDHLGRPEGMAKAFRSADWPELKYREPPPWPWTLDSNALGTNDFRATKRKIYRVSLTDADGSGIQVLSDCKHHTRSFVEGDRIGLLVAQYSAGGEGFFQSERRDVGRRPLTPGDVLEDTVRIEIVRPTE